MHYVVSSCFNRDYAPLTSASSVCLPHLTCMHYGTMLLLAQWKFAPLMAARCVCLQYINDAATGSGDHSETDDVSDAVEQSVTRPSSTEPTSKVHPQSIIHSNSYTITMCRTTYVYVRMCTAA